VGNFFFSDVLGTLVASLLFVFVLVVPGYLCGFAGDLFGFRSMDMNWRIVASVPLSAIISPLLIYLGLRFTGVWFLWVAFAFIWALSIALFAGFFGHENPSQIRSTLGPVPRVAIGFAALWCLVAVFLLADLQIGQRAYYSAVAYDHGFRVAVTDAITRTGLPADSPFVRLNGPVALRYHVYWFALCSFVERLSGGYLTARHALSASVVWAGFALMCLIPLWLHVFEGLEGPVLRRRAVIGVGLLSVTGLDLLPGVLWPLVHHWAPRADIEWWGGVDQVTSWADATLWVPHHVAALVVGLTGFLLVWHAAANRRAPFIHAIMAGCAFACATGCSIYVGFVLAAALAAWFGVTLICGWMRHAALLAISGGAALLLSLPNLLQVLSASVPGSKFIKPGLWNSSPFMAFAMPLNRVQSPISWGAVRLLSFGAEYGIEFGFFLLIGVLKLNRFRTSGKLRPQDLATLAISGTAMFLCTFFRSATGSNDLGWRGMMLVQFVLVIWATDVLDPYLTTERRKAGKPGWLPVAYVLMFCGFLGTVAQLTILRFETIAVDAGLLPSTNFSRGASQRTYSLRILYSRLDRMLPGNAVVQVNPDNGVDIEWGLYSHRQTAASGRDCVVADGGDARTCEAAMPSILRLFDASLADPKDAQAIARKYRIDAVIVDDADSVWGNSESWIHKIPPAVDTAAARAFLFDK
jgi:hypothetical protein